MHAVDVPPIVTAFGGLHRTLNKSRCKCNDIHGAKGTFLLRKLDALGASL